MKGDCLEKAAEVWWGDWIDLSKADLQTSSTPEYLLMQKELLTILSNEAKDLIAIISELPDEMFLSSGRLIWRELNKVLRRKGWSWKKINLVREELQEKM